MQTNYECIPCGFANKNRGLFMKHLETKKHATKTGTLNDHICSICKKNFQHRQSLSRHKKGCQNMGVMGSSNLTPDFVMSLMKQNEELKTMLIEERKLMENRIQSNQELLMQQNRELMEYCKQPKIIETKNQFNLNFFLNEKCKDAINLTEFVKNLRIQLEDVEKMGKLGYVDGMTQIIMNGLKNLDMYKRPIHCTDLKREIMYVREENRWDCDEEKEKLQKAIGLIHDENFRVLYSFVGKNGGEFDAENPNIERNLSIVRECNGGLSEEVREKNRDKLIRNLSKSVYLDKMGL